MSFMGHAQSSVAGLGEQEKVWPTVERDAGERVEGTTPPCSRNAEPDSKNTPMRSSFSKSPSRGTSLKSPAISPQKTSPPKTSGQRITRSSPVAAQSNIGTSKSPTKTADDDDELLSLHYAKAKTTRVKQKLNLGGRSTRSTHPV